MVGEVVVELVSEVVVNLVVVLLVVLLMRRYCHHLHRLPHFHPRDFHTT